MQTKKQAPKKTIKETKQEMLKRLIAKASLDFRCCGHGGKDSKR